MSRKRVILAAFLAVSCTFAAIDKDDLIPPCPDGKTPLEVKLEVGTSGRFLAPSAFDGLMEGNELALKDWRARSALDAQMCFKNLGGRFIEGTGVDVTHPFYLPIDNACVEINSREFNCHIDLSIWWACCPTW